MKISAWLTHPDIPCFNLSREHADFIEASLEGVRVKICRDREEFTASLNESEIVLVWTFLQEWFAQAPKLRWIVTPAAGRDYFQVETPEGIAIDYCSFHGEIIAETVIGMLLAHCRGLREVDLLTRTNPWPRRELAAKLVPLRGSRLTILGFGSIGAWIAKLAKPFGVRITGIRRQPDPAPEFFEDGDKLLGIESLDEALANTDHLVLALPSGKETDQLMDERRLGLLPENATISNIGRGNSLDEAALAAALREGRLAAAWLDVFHNEPLEEDSPLRSCRNAFIMPHCSAVSPNYLELFCDEFINKFRARGDL
ncbi:MAG: D-2-hydroxyacid dehydrogenase [Planctomycetes bacterium]|nr:D-2-hydroxyacid dehydrogenase [Planctomycetota bacterium]